MKFIGQTKDGLIDNLLRAYVSRPGNPRQVCPDFDPDRAGAYVERGLTGASRLQYEEHLSACAACRTSVVALKRMADADTVAPAYQAPEVAQSSWLAGMKHLLGTMSQPQWAIAAAAVIVFAISLPLLLSRHQAQEPAQAVAEIDKFQEAAPPASPSAGLKPGEAAPSLVATAKQREHSDEKTEALPRKALAATAPESAAAGGSGTVELAKKSDTRSQSGEELQRKTENQVSQAAPQTGAAPGSQVTKSALDQVKQQQPDKDAAQPVNEPKVVARADDERAKEKSARAEEVAPPPAPSASSEGRPHGRAGKLALRDSNAAEAVRPEERKYNGKKFLFRDGAWTDKEFDPNKDLPIVTIIRDSNVYMEVLNKRPGLKPFLTSFAAGERAIIVYKGTVYKLIPQ
jgi:hypothetical protein